MKCPKCEYLGFDTGERCRNCGYDFSLMAAPADEVPDLALRSEEEEGPALWLNDLDKVLGEHEPPLASPTGAAPSVAALSPAAAAALTFEPTLPPPSFRGEPALPLFSRDALADDEPMIRVPLQPRAPLSVRRTPETPRLRSVPKTFEISAAAPELDFADEPVVVPARAKSTRSDSRPLPELQTSGVGIRILAAGIDHAILFTIDMAVIYLTLRIAALSLSDLAQVPILPMGAFLGLLKLAYFTAFTCVGGQTIGKMAVGIRVVGEDQRVLDAPHAMHRALAGAVSFLTFGLGFLPALFGSDHRALHDRLARTRVVVLPGA